MYRSILTMLLAAPGQFAFAAILMTLSVFTMMSLTSSAQAQLFSTMKVPGIQDYTNGDTKMFGTKQPGSGLLVAPPDAIPAQYRPRCQGHVVNTSRYHMYSCPSPGKNRPKITDHRKRGRK